MKRKLAHKLRLAALCALLVPFLLTSLIASGVMPARSQSGAVLLVICTAEGMAELLVDPETMQPADKSAPHAPEKSGQPCAWAVSQATFTLPELPALMPPQQSVIAMPASIAPVILTAARATGLPPSTGPPFRV